MRIAVLGTGVVGQTLAGKLAELGHELVVGTREVGALGSAEPLLHVLGVLAVRCDVEVTITRGEAFLERGREASLPVEAVLIVRRYQLIADSTAEQEERR